MLLPAYAALALEALHASSCFQAMPGTLQLLLTLLQLGCAAAGLQASFQRSCRHAVKEGSLCIATILSWYSLRTLHAALQQGPDVVTVSAAFCAALHLARQDACRATTHKRISV